MYYGYREEGDKCGEKGCAGVLGYSKVENCSCHISPPCGACVSNPLSCPECGWTNESEPEYTYKATEYAGLAQQIFKPRPLDKTKIDWRSEGHSNSSMIKKGVYPEGTSMKEVEEKVRGTFGGRFEYFRDGKFKYIAYTD